MKILSRTLLACAVSVVAGNESTYGMGFHGGGGGGGFGGGMHAGGFGGGSFGGSHGSFGGGGGSFGGYRGGDFGGGRGGDFGGGGDFGNRGFGGGGDFGSHDFGGGGNFGGDGGFGSHGGVPSFGGAGSRPEGGFGSGGFGDRGAGGEGFNNHVSNDQLQNFLGLSSRPGQGGSGTRVDNQNFNRNSNNTINSNNKFNNDNINVNNTQIGNQNRLGQGGAGERNEWAANHPEQAQKVSDWGNQVRDNWNNNGHDWWHSYHPNVNSWYYHGWGYHPWNYWWRGAGWGAVGGFMLGAAFDTPIYYSYGTGGNVVYQNDSVYVNGQDMGSSDAYYQSVANLATVPQDEIPQNSSGTDNADANSGNAQGSGDDWLPLGTFSLSTSKEDKNPVRTIQLAVNKDGVISGTMYNSSTNQSWPVQGRVDKKTQQVAFTIGKQAGVVLETGIYNLTQPQTEVLVHYGSKQTQTDLLVRLDPPKDSSGDSGGSDDNGPLPDSPPGQ
ncbi:hypothetical protein SH661x_002093 [Planctomicrobium sp. SH661]|uniref:hypothetical protein n=1 Tax=Planctomicrobium sp. SH661 TaxID=3448124 RepID=UPI003F5B8092